MKVGITFDLKPDSPPISCTGTAGWGEQSGCPDDIDEEFDCPVTIDAIAAAIEGLNHQVERLGDGRRLVERLLVDPPDFVFNMAEGHGVSRTREARVPALLEMLGIPYTGSDPLTLAATLDKDCAKRLVASAGVAVPSGFVSNGNCRLPHLKFPVIVKPAWEGSSKGVRGACVIDQHSDLENAIERLAADYRQPVLVEEFIDGMELTVGIVGNDPPTILGVMSVAPRTATERFVYSLEVKRDFRRQVRYQCPPDLPRQTIRSVEKAALACFEALGCRDVARIDFRMKDQVPYFIETNPLPGLNPESSDLVIMADLCGWEYTRLVRAIFQAALDRHARDDSPKLSVVS